MEIRSGGLPQSSTFSDVLGLIELIGNPKKTKEALEGLSSDIADFQAANQLNLAQLENIAKQKQELMEGFEKLKSETAILEAKQNEYFRVSKLLSDKSEVLNFRENEMTENEKQRVHNYAQAVEKLKKSQAESDDKINDAIISLNKSDALIAEYEAKLARLKEMVG